MMQAVEHCGCQAPQIGLEEWFGPRLLLIINSLIYAKVFHVYRKMSLMKYTSETQRFVHSNKRTKGHGCFGRDIRVFFN